MKTIRYVSGGLFVAAALSLGACSVESGGTGEATGESVAFTNDQGETVAPLETLSFDGGVKVGFFEPNPGDLKVLSWGPNGAEAPITKELVDEGLSATELYAKLSGAEAPDTLVAAQERAHASAVGAPTESEVLNASYQAPISTGAAPVTGDAASKEQGVYYYDCTGSFSYDEWFNCNFCYGGGDYDVTWMWVTGDGSFTRNDRNHTYTTVSVYGGGALNLKVEKRTWSSWSTSLNTSVANGFWVQSELGWDYLDFDTRAAVTQAAGDSYHWCSYGWST